MRLNIYSILLSLLLASATLGFDYVYLSDIETIDGGDTVQFFNGDTLGGYVRTNDCFYCPPHGLDVDYLIMSCTETNCNGYNYDVVTGAAPIPFPENADNLRNRIPNYGGIHFERGPEDRAVVRFDGIVMHVWWGTRGTPVSMSLPPDEIHAMAPNGTYFFECPIRIAGVIGPDLPDVVIASSGDIGLDDDLVVAEYEDFPHQIPFYATTRIALVSEGDIVIMNTWANGRNNSAQGQGIIITAFLVALGESFTFAQQNQPEDSYICQCAPDERGQIHLRGAIAQKRRGYFHRSGRGGTGYLKDFRFDSRLLTWNIGLFPDEPPEIIPAEIDFDDVTVGATAWDTITVAGFPSSIFSGAVTTYPFYSPAGYQQGGPFTVPVSFTPTQAGNYNGLLYFYLNGAYRSVPLHGTGVNPPGAAVVMSIAPNPFNPLTTIMFSLSAEQDVSLRVYNIAGQLVESLADEKFPAGDHRFQFDGSALASGVYFLKLHAGEIRAIEKIVLLR
jgi:hypothetical protein